jgi:hypothetical protein
LMDSSESFVLDLAVFRFLTGCDGWLCANRA